MPAGMPQGRLRPPPCPSSLLEVRRPSRPPPTTHSPQALGDFQMAMANADATPFMPNWIEITRRVLRQAAESVEWRRRPLPAASWRLPPAMQLPQAACQGGRVAATGTRGSRRSPLPARLPACLCPPPPPPRLACRAGWPRWCRSWRSAPTRLMTMQRSLGPPPAGRCSPRTRCRARPAAAAAAAGAAPLPRAPRGLRPRRCPAADRRRPVCHLY